MHKGQYKGLLSGSLKGTIKGLSSGLVKGLHPNDKNRKAKRDVFLAIGDSNAGGKGRTLGPVTKPDTLYNWVNPNLTMITAQDISTNTGGIYGTSYKQFSIDYKAATGRSVVMINRGKGGADFYPDGDTDNWYSSGGTLYAAMQTEVSSCLKALGIPQLTGIFVNLGINDARGSQTLVNISTGITSLFTRLLADFPGVPILVIQVGMRDGIVLNNNRICTIRDYIRTQVVNNANVHFVSHNGSFFKRGVVNDYYDSETLHLDQAGNNIQGSQMARWFTLGYRSKWARSVLSAMMVLPSMARQTLIANFIDNQVASSNYFKLEFLTLFKTNSKDNVYFDLGFLWMISDRVDPCGFTVDDNLNTNGSTNFMAGFNMTLSSSSVASQNDIIIGVKLKSNDSPNPSNGALFGGREAAINPTILCLQVSSAATQYMTNDITGSGDGTLTRLSNDKLYSVARNGTTKYFIEDSTVRASVVQASTGKNNDAVCIGALNTGDVRSFFFAGKYEYWFGARYSTFDLSGFITAIETLLDNW